MFELELHANVSKHLVLARFLAGSGRAARSSAAARAWLRWHLFHKGNAQRTTEPDVRARYRERDSLGAPASST